MNRLIGSRPRPGTRRPVGARQRTAAPCSATCGTRQTLDRLADRWTILLIEQLIDGPRRFGELRAGIDGISAKMLAQTLRSLERDGLVRRSTAYQLTDLGASLLEPLLAVRSWARLHIDEVEHAREAYDAAAR